MKMMSKLFLIVLLSCGILFAQEENEKQEEGKKAPDFVLKNLKGENYRLSENTGKGPIVINFWATWCVP